MRQTKILKVIFIFMGQWAYITLWSLSQNFNKVLAPPKINMKNYKKIYEEKKYNSDFASRIAYLLIAELDRDYLIDLHCKSPKDELLINSIGFMTDFYSTIEEEEFTPIEQIMYAVLLRIKYHFYFMSKQEDFIYVSPQHEIGKYRVDFLIDSDFFTKKIIIECDGFAFHEKTKEQMQYEKERDRYFTSQDYLVLHYTGNEIIYNFDSIEEEIRDLIEEVRFKYITFHEEIIETWLKTASISDKEKIINILKDKKQ